jgi:hypothetical protein
MVNLSPVDPKVLSLGDTEILALTLIGEARGEPIEGQVAVGCVVRNRLHGNPTKYRNYSDVCLEKEQFSCWNIFDVNYPFLLDMCNQMIDNRTFDDPYIRQCFLVANGVVDGSIRDNTKGAQFYLAGWIINSDKVPAWAKKPKNPIALGSQTFFNI